MTEVKNKDKIKVEESSLEFDARIKPTVISGCKTTTIRKGHRYFKKSITIGKERATINWQHHFILSTVPLNILVREGFNSIFDCLQKLQRYYPDISLLSPVTVIEFRLEVTDGGSTHPVDKAVNEWLR